MRRTPRFALAALTSLALWIAAGVPSPAAAQDDDSAERVPPVAASTSGEASLQSGRTLGVGETMIGAAAGWPWIWAQVELGLSSAFNLGVRVAMLYGSPIMALEAGVGGELAVPMRIHVYGQHDHDLDVSIFATPAFTFGEAAGVGEGGTVFSGDFGWSSRLELGALIGYRAMERFTLLFGLGGHVGFVHTEAVGDPEVIGGLLARFGLEGLISRDTMLFAVAEGGVGFVPDRGAGAPLFRGGVPPILRISLGVAYLL